MPKEYLLLFNAITDAIKGLDLVRKVLIDSQRFAEDMYIASADDSEGRPN